MEEKIGKVCTVTITLSNCWSSFTWRGANPNPTRKFAAQFVATAIEDAMGLPDWLKSSVTKNQGMEPGPVANPITKMITIAMERYLKKGTSCMSYRAVISMGMLADVCSYMYVHLEDQTEKQ